MANNLSEISTLLGFEVMLNAIYKMLDNKILQLIQLIVNYICQRFCFKLLSNIFIHNSLIPTCYQPVKLFIFCESHVKLEIYIGHIFMLH